MDRLILSENICYYSKKNNLTVEELAEKLGKSTRQVNRYRNGQFNTIPFSVLEKLTIVFGVTISELLTQQH